MIIKSKHRLPIIASDTVTQYPVLPLMTGVLFPGMILTVQVARPENIKVIKNHLADNNMFVSSYSHSDANTPGPSPVHQVGVFTVVRDVKERPAGTMLVTLEGIRRAFIREIVSTDPYMVASVSEVQRPAYASEKINGKMQEVVSVVDQITRLDPIYSPEMLNVLKMSVEAPSLLADSVASTFHLSLSSKQEILEKVNLTDRYEQLLLLLSDELSKITTAVSVDEKVRQRIEEDQTKYYLRQQLLEIRRQLGEDMAEEREAAHFRQLIQNWPELPEEVIAAARIEIDRLTQLSPASAEYGVTKNYLEWLLGMPWGKFGEENYDMEEVATSLAAGYYGPASVKDQILERLSVRKLSVGVDEGPTLCIVGAPGTGKASLARAIAVALGKEFARISVGGITEVSDIKGLPRTYVSAMPGKIVRALRDTATCDAVVLIEDIDYFNVENDASVNQGLLEVIDTRVNSKFMDTYLGIPFDLSRILFICSVRSYEELPEQFVPRLEVLEIPGYIEREKIAIAKRYMIPNLLKKHGLRKSEFKLTDKVLSTIISSYTLESGLLGLSQQIEKIFRKIALEKAHKGKVTSKIDQRNLQSFLGVAQFIPEKAETAPEIGIATGLAWTGSGGELMFIEALKMKGEGHIATTGSLGDVMRESVQAAHSYVRSKADMLGIDFNDFRDFDIHVHFPSGAIPKDGPSAGVTVSLVIASIMSERPIRNDIAMTGEVTLRGRVLAVGGVKEKISAAHRAGIYNVAVPKANEKDVGELPKEILRKVKFYYIERVDELFELCLLDFTPSTYTLEKIFAEEVEKVKTTKKKPPENKPQRPSARAKGSGKKPN